MPHHWTYASFDPNSDLMQGDLIQPSEQVRSVLSGAHKHFLDSKYIAFLVLTQSCDLVRRDGAPCKSRYINIAVVRPIEDVLTSLLDAECGRVEFLDKSLPGIYLLETKQRAQQLLGRILNQNEQGLGLFYIHPEVDVEIAVPSVALLQVNMALRREHYDALIKARSGRLTSEFQSRLGWIVGNLYSRVATRDWPIGKTNELVNGVIESSIAAGKGPFWLGKDIVEEAKRKAFKVEGRKAMEVMREMTQIKLKKKKEIAIEQVINVLKEVIPPVNPNDYDSFRQRLINDQVLAALFKNK